MKNGRDATWYKDAILYELHVRAFMDSNGDGVGDFGGLIQKLDYVAELGVTAIWLLPFYPSPGRDDGYDIADYRTVNPHYGTVAQVRRFIRAAHERGIRVITEMVANHTSDQHPWFQRARRARPDSQARDWYVWSDTPEKYRDARIIFKDFETSNWAWDEVARAYYWHRFYSHQPDLNYDNPRVRAEIKRIVDFWLGMGVDGLRLDAIPYLYEREGTSCENLPESHQFLKELRAHIDGSFEDRMLLAEANQWPDEAVTYFGAGDECHMAFHFPLMPRLFMALQMEDRFPIIDILAQTPAIPENAQWALFLRNHDELTLEMVTDEERDYMWRVYSSDPNARINLGIRRRLAPLMNNNRRRIELMNGLLLSMPGTPVIYYGDEIGMGDNIYLGDRNGVRTPMQWSADRNSGFSEANRQRLYLPVIVDPEYHYEAVNVETQAANPQSLLNWMRRLIALRRRHPAFGRGTIEFLHPDNRKVLAFIRCYDEEKIVVVANLSRFTQWVQLDLTQFDGQRLVELFGRTEFPPITRQPYMLTLAPHSFFWFAVEPVRQAAPVEVRPHRVEDVPELVLSAGIAGLVRGEDNARLEEILPSYIASQRWFGSKARAISGVQLLDSVPVTHGLGTTHVAVVEVSYVDGAPEAYFLPVAIARGGLVERVWERAPWAVLARLANTRGATIIDALADPGFAQALLDAISERRRFRGLAGDLVALPSPLLRRLRGDQGDLAPELSGAEQSNNSVVFAERLILKVYRRLEEGINPDVEVGRFLTDRTNFRNIAPVAGSMLYRRHSGGVSVVGMLQQYIPHRGDSWEYVQQLLDQVTANPNSPEVATRFQDQARLLGRRTAEMHRALASDPDDPAFRPEPTSMLDARSVYQSIRSLQSQTFEQLKAVRPRLDPALVADADRLFGTQAALLERARGIIQRPLTAQRIRVHGDYHLGQVLWTGTDFIVIDFEGEPARPLSERRLKRWAFKDVAGMLRSLDYAAAVAAQGERPTAEAAAWAWAASVSDAYLQGYMEVASGASFMPKTPEETKLLLDAMLIEKALYELRYELNNRPDWVRIPLRGLLALAGQPTEVATP
ncbi:MAG TPA: maltose alpha-D-glucosyltransferase [Candidatus Dormibacteraeota bacterium]